MFQDQVSQTLGKEAEVGHFFDGLQAHLKIGWDLHVFHLHECQNLKSVDHIPNVFHRRFNDYCDDEFHYYAIVNGAVDETKSLIH